MPWMRIPLDEAALPLLQACWPISSDSAALRALRDHQLTSEDIGWLDKPRSVQDLAVLVEDLAGSPELLAVALERPESERLAVLAVGGILLLDDAAALPLLQQAFKHGHLPEMGAEGTELLALSALVASLETGEPEPASAPDASAPMLGALLGLDAGDGWEEVPPWCGKVVGGGLFLED